MYVLGIHLGHDSSCALVKDGVVIAAAQEERFTRLKHYSGVPVRSLDFCLRQVGIIISQVDLLVIPALVTRIEIKALLHLEDKIVFQSEGDNINKNLVYFTKTLLIKIIQMLRQTTLIEPPIYVPYYDARQVKILNIEHHLAHAACAYYGSGFTQDTLVLTADGSGDGLSLTLWQGSQGKLEALVKIGRGGSLGAFYSTVTEALGWIVGDGEGKVMGLAPYGNTTKTHGVLDFIRPHYNAGQLVRQYDWGWPSIWPDMGTEHWHFAQSLRVKQLVDQYGPENIAAEAQRVLEIELLDIVGAWVKRTGIRQLAAAGGVMLNVKANQKIWESGLVDDFYIFPDSGDGGISTGGALYGYYKKHPSLPLKKIDAVYWGPAFTDMDIEAMLNVRRIKYIRLSTQQLPIKISKLLASGKIVGWFQGRMEVGPRALGNRSILMDPRRAKNKDIINKRVKYRESFRPFCPSVLDDKAQDYLQDLTDAPFMIISCVATKSAAKQIPAVVHVDRTLRPQIVTSKANPLYYQLIKEFGKQTGVYVLLNTSFNIKGEPIVCSPEDAIKCFYDTGLDYLVLNSFIIKK